MLRNLLTRDSPENPATPLNYPAKWFVDWATGGESSSGVTINETTALTYAAVWRATNLISGDVAKLPLFVYERTGEGKERATNHPAYQLLRYRPNDYQTAFVFRFIMQAWALLRGNGYAWIERNGRADPIALHPLDPDNVTPRLADGVLQYVHRLAGGSEVIYEGDDILHVRGLGDTEKGVGIITKARESFGLGLAAQKFGARFFSNSARPPAVLEHPGRLDDEVAKRIRASWNEVHQGIDNAHKVAVLEEGMRLNAYGLSNEDSQFLETRQFEIREVANWFGLPPHKLGDPTRTSFASLEQENQAYLDGALDPWLVCWEAETREKLLSKGQQQRDSHLVEFLRAALARANLKDRGAFYNLAIQGGWMSRNEVRARENLNPIEGGDELLVPLNMSPIGSEENGGGGDDVEGSSSSSADDRSKSPDVGGPPTNPDQSNNPQLREALQLVLLDVAHRNTKRILSQAKRAATSAKEWRLWRLRVIESNRGVCAEAFHPVLAAMVSARLVRKGSDEFCSSYTNLFFRRLMSRLDSIAESPDVLRDIEELQEIYPEEVSGDVWDL